MASSQYLLNVGDLQNANNKVQRMLKLNNPHLLTYSDYSLFIQNGGEAEM